MQYYNLSRYSVYYTYKGMHSLVSVVVDLIPVFSYTGLLHEFSSFVRVRYVIATLAEPAGR